MNEAALRQDAGFVAQGQVPTMFWVFNALHSLRDGDVSMHTERSSALLPHGILGPWPREEAHVPDGPGWHARREEGFPAESVPQYLYGYGGGEAWDHPARLIPSARRARRARRAPAAA